MTDLFLLKKLIFDDVRKMNRPTTGKVFTVCFGPASQSIERGRISRREPLMLAKVENGVTKPCQFLRRKNRKNAQFKPEIFHFFEQDRLFLVAKEVPKARKKK